MLSPTVRRPKHAISTFVIVWLSSITLCGTTHAQTAAEPQLIRGSFPSLAVAPEQSSGNLPPGDEGVIRGGEPSTANHEDDASVPMLANLGPLTSVTSSLAIVLGLFAALVYVTRRWGKTQAAGLPSDLIETLGVHRVDAKTTLVVMRIAARVVVASRSGATLHPVCEFTSTEQVQQILAACQRKSRDAFATTLQEIASEPMTKGFAGEAARPATTTHPSRAARGNGRLFATA